MTENQSTEATTDETTEVAVEKPVYEKGTWQAAINQSTILADKGVTYKRRAGVLLWQGASKAITEWVPGSDTDVSAEGLYSDLKAIMGTARKGDASKIRTVAVAVRSHDMDLATFGTLAKAYAEARRLTQTVQANAAEDDAAESAVRALADFAALSAAANTPEDAAKIVLAKGVDEAARLLLDALGVDNNSAHRSLVRAIAAETAGRVKPVKSTATAGPKDGASQATKKAAPKATVKTAGTKAKAPAMKATPTKATPVSASKGDPNAKALPPKAAPVEAAAKPEATTATAPVEAPAKATPVAVKAAKIAVAKA